MVLTAVELADGNHSHSQIPDRGEGAHHERIR